MEAARTEYVYTREWRKTRRGAVTYPIAVCLTCREVIEPVRIRVSKAGTHGEFVFAHEHPLKFVMLYESNAGRRSASTLSEELDRIVRSAWVAGAREEEVKELVRSLIKWAEKDL